MFIDASALVAIVANEIDGAVLKQKVKNERHNLTSPMACFEACLAIRRLHKLTPLQALEIVNQFNKIYEVKQVSIEPRMTEVAIRAFERFGKGSGHKAKLNMGDCFSYACAKAHNVPLLYKGNDFIHTDIERA